MVGASLQFVLRVANDGFPLDAIAVSQCDFGSPTRARTWDLRINSPSLSCVILLHHQLLTASAQLRHRSRMQCNAGVRKTAQLHFRIHLKNGMGTFVPVCDARGTKRQRSKRARPLDERDRQAGCNRRNSSVDGSWQRDFRDLASIPTRVDHCGARDSRRWTQDRTRRPYLAVTWPW